MKARTTVRKKKVETQVIVGVMTNKSLGGLIKGFELLLGEERL